MVPAGSQPGRSTEVLGSPCRGTDQLFEAVFGSLAPFSRRDLSGAVLCRCRVPPSCVRAVEVSPPLGGSHACGDATLCRQWKVGAGVASDLRNTTPSHVRSRTFR
jgi:hypothetical protein